MRVRSILAGLFGLLAALVVHAGILLFGGWFFLKDEAPPPSTVPVDLLGDVENPEVRREPEQPKPEEVQEQPDEAPPNADSIVERLDESPAPSAAPALDATSLAGLANALGGVAGMGGDFFGAAASLESGGVIGGSGRRGAEGKDPVDGFFDSADIDQKARPVVQTSPTYPAEMRGKKVEGVVTLIFVVNADGRVESPKVESSTHKAFESPALAALRKWKFEPGVRGGERVASKVRISIRFPAT